MGNIAVTIHNNWDYNTNTVSDNNDVKTAITQDMENSLTGVSSGLVYEIWVRRAYKGCFEITIF